MQRLAIDSLYALDPGHMGFMVGCEPWKRKRFPAPDPSPHLLISSDSHICWPYATVPSTYPDISISDSVCLAWRLVR